MPVLEMTFEKAMEKESSSSAEALAFGHGIEKLVDSSDTSSQVSEKTKDNTNETLKAEAIKKEEDNSLICVSADGIIKLNRKMLVDLDMTAAECDKPKIDVSDGVVKLNQEWGNGRYEEVCGVLVQEVISAASVNK